ncbi:MAG: biotin--[acetyl-CoA-carboxylase] ligase, partial [Pseudomonadota bacterium]|nr:biotin--[acetyl-CoA-carboxylase] ligase [Pseudomonadota bacterium]
MLEAARQADAGKSGPFVVCARAQTGGVGRHGRRWSSPPGNLYWTILLDDPADLPRDAGLAFAAGLATIDALAASGVSGGRLRLKWPNDILLDTRKLAGLLVEASVTGTRSRTIVGIGINIATCPPDTAFPATSLAEAGVHVSVDALR